MKKIFTLLAVCYPLFALAQLSANDLFSIAQIRNGVKSKRVSSYDTSGNNNDRVENIKPGEKRVLFNATGAGIIITSGLRLHPVLKILREMI
jgi:hypothetical protein